MKKDFVFKKYSEEYKEQVIDLLETLWQFNREKRLAYFKWKFEDNPYTQEPMAFIALDGNKVVAFRGYMVQPMVFENLQFMEASLADTVTHSNYRRMGLFKSLTNFSISEISKMGNIYVSLNSSSGGPTLNGYLSLGWVPLIKREHLFKFSLIGILKYLFRIKGLKESVYTNKYLKDGRIEITDVLRAEDMVQIPYKKDKITHNRDLQYYSWRLKNPISKYIYCYKYKKSGEINAYIVLKEIRYGKYDLIDYNYLEKNSLKELLSVFTKKMSPFYILYWSVNPGSLLSREKYKFGFYSLNFILSKIKKFRKPPFLVRSFNSDSIDLNLYTSIRDINQWNLFKIIGDEI